MEQSLAETPVPTIPSNSSHNSNTKFILLTVFFIILMVLSAVGFWLWHTNNEKQLIAKYEAQLTEFENTVKQVKQLEGDNQQLGQDKQTLELKVDELGQQMCKGIWKDGKCNMATCTDSDINDRPNDIYIKGKVTYLSPVTGKISEFVDECQDATHVFEYICKESRAGSGVYDARTEIFTCPKGCLDGVCQK